ncbi:hemin uptake protein hemP [Roseibium hamelinense]|uniref:Hemin uptake protein hemP n=1 Tax=Roseibium hamelinense TaxID=150831 RepID=A0A562T3K4_9HYPH|nr:hemin uptake protein HemP [Roseibium hamelinense]MTI44502.1 hemin uptake protein HemP [Roseibium hamelinense]TWI87470.1 hemin uptake protein hemP [Roseibium hamelinense]
MQTSNIRQNRLRLPVNPALPPHQRSNTSVDDKHTADLDTRGLFKGRRELKIQHNGDVYRLTITKLGKLILTK